MALQKTATDPETGLINMDILTTGKTSASRKRIDDICEKLKTIFKSNIGKFKKTCKVEDLKEDLDRVWNVS